FMSWLEARNERLGTPTIVCEMIASYGMGVGQSVFETCVFIGQLLNRHPEMIRVTRNAVKVAVCKDSKAKDSNIRLALIDHWGPAGKRAAPWPTFGISTDIWAALAVATAYQHACKLYQCNI